MTASDADGYNRPRCMRTSFDHTESGGDQNQGRGYMGRGKTDADIMPPQEQPQSHDFQHEHPTPPAARFRLLSTVKYR